MNPPSDSAKVHTLSLVYNPTGEEVVWAYWREPKVRLIHPDGPLSKSRWGSGWTIRTDDGTERFVEGTRADLGERIRCLLTSYDSTLKTPFPGINPPCRDAAAGGVSLDVDALLAQTPVFDEAMRERLSLAAAGVE